MPLDLQRRLSEPHTFWDDLRNYFEEDSDRIERIESVIVDLDFTLLD